MRARFRRKIGDRADTAVPWFATKVVCAKCGARGRHIDVLPNWKEQPPRESLTGKVWADGISPDCDPYHMAVS
jgi:hypothetical protein